MINKKNILYFLAYTLLVIGISSWCTTMWIEKFVLSGGQQEMLVDKGEEGAANSPVRDENAIIEVFSYACHFCQQSSNDVQALEANMPAGKKVVYLHINDGSGNWLSGSARVFATLNVMGIEKQHRAALYDAVINQQLNTSDIQQFNAWLTKNGINVETYRQAEASAEVADALDYMKAVTAYYKINGTPAFIIGKRWVTYQDSEFGEFSKKMIGLLASQDKP
ncbi:DsbA family protein [Chimaeribacter arupi]|uniref:DsbA family protein n=1 Tax=Chimaeribacter arupi TaxID=2060066 RepID=UPI002944BF5A|nr:DsbA family protein [Chimaeribacter arupi]MDV5142314.1 DsbA family protein [Chimaeribacter arupi]